MQNTYPARYSDKFGEEVTTVQNDGNKFRMTVRGVNFVGNCFNYFDKPENIKEDKILQFNFFKDELCGYSLEFDVPVVVVSNKRQVESVLTIHFEYGEPEDNKKIVHELLQLKLAFEGKSYKSHGRVGYDTIDEQLWSLKLKLPPEIYIEICWYCVFSDYVPGGSGFFGNLACFRQCKDEYLDVKTKQDLFRVLADKRHEFVQEIHLCPEFELRIPGKGGHQIW